MLDRESTHEKTSQTRRTAARATSSRVDADRPAEYRAAWPSEEPTVAAQYLALLASHGVRYLFVNAGTDFAPLIEAHARQSAAQVPFPTPILGAHENLVMGMAHGAYLVTGEPQVVMMHVSVGTANAICATINASRERVPLLVTAGRTPILEHGAVGARNVYVHWAQEMYDQAGMLREFVKWDYELRDGRHLRDVVERAFSVATTHPRGPVYLTLPREVLADEASAPTDGIGTFASATPPNPATDAIETLADRLASARFPVIVTMSAGADIHAVGPLASLCERFAIGVAEAVPRYVNVPYDHRFHLGDPHPVFADADVVVFLECDVPWMPTHGSVRADAFVAHIGLDPLFQAYPIRSFRSDLSVTGSAVSVLDGLAVALAAREGEIDPARADLLAERACEVEHRRSTLEERERAASGPITKAFISLTLADVIDDEALVFNEYPLLFPLLRRRRPGSYFNFPSAGGLGWALPAALGAKLAAPDRTIVAAIGDGAYLFANPAACHHAAAKHHLPVLTIVANNSRWEAVDRATASIYPAGAAVAVREKRWSDLSPSPAFEEYVKASGGYGERVTERTGLRPALERALDAVATRCQQALLNIECA